MLRATLRSLLARKLRLVLSALAVVLGVAFVSGTYVLTDTINATFNNIFTEANAHVTVAVQGASSISGQGGAEERNTVPEGALPVVRSVPGVQTAQGLVQSVAQLIGTDGKTIKTPVPLGTSWTNDPLLSPLTLVAGQQPHGPDQIAVDRKTAEDNKLAVGTRVRVITFTASSVYTITGVFRFGSADSLAGATLTAFDLPTAQRVFNLPGQFTAIYAAGDQSVSDTVLAGRVQAALENAGLTGIEAITGKQASEQAADQIQQNLGFLKTILLIFGFIAVFVGAFIIANTFQMLVAQRVRELALLRALGASRRQVNFSILGEAAVIGLVGATIGLALGVLLALGLQQLLSAFGLDIPTTSLVFQLRTAVVAYAVGLLVTVGSAAYPALKASRVPPVAAMRDVSLEPTRSLTLRSGLGAGLAVVGGVVLVLGLAAGKVPIVGLGATCVFLGVTMLSPVLSRPVIRVLGVPLTKLAGAVGKLSEENALRNPRRTSATASALMIGIALVAAFSVLFSSINESVKAVFETSLSADFVISSSQQGGGLSPAVAAAIPPSKDGVQAVAGLATGNARVDGARKTLEGIDPAVLTQVLNMTTVSGDLVPALESGQLAVSQDEAKSRNWTVGRAVTVEFAKSGQHDFRVGAIYAQNQLAGAYLVSKDVMNANFNNPLDIVVLVRAVPGADLSRVQQAIEKDLASFPNAKVQTQRQYVDSLEQQINQLLMLIVALLLLAIVIALLGIVNTLALSIVERTHEIGLLRAVGMTRVQLRRMVRYEAGIIATYGGILGLAVGTFFGWALVSALGDQGIDKFAVSIPQLVACLVAAGLAGVLAAVWPARRAAKLDMLRAIAAT